MSGWRRFLPKEHGAYSQIAFPLAAAYGVAGVSIGSLLLERWLQPTVIMAAVPGLLTAVIVAVCPPAPARLRPLGWSLVAVSTLTAAIVVATR